MMCFTHPIRSAGRRTELKMYLLHTTTSYDCPQARQGIEPCGSLLCRSSRCRGVWCTHYTCRTGVGLVGRHLLVNNRCVYGP